MSKPSLRNRLPLVLIPQHFGCLVFDRRTSRYMPFDIESTKLLSRMTTQRFDQILMEEVDDDQSRRLIDFFEYFQKANFFSASGKLLANVLGVTPPEDHLTGPLATHLEVIGACNLTCKHCFAGVLPRNQNPLTLAEMELLFGELAELGAYRLGLTGGEPLMRKDLFEIIDSAVDHGLHPCLTTNGLLIDETVAKKFAQRELVWLNVSLDGATPGVNDRIRGAGVFDQVVEKIKILRLFARFTLAFTLTRQSVAEIEACAQLAKELGAHTAVFRPMYPVGVGKSHLDLMPSFESYTDALNRLENAIEPDANLRGIDPFSPQARVDQQAKVYSNQGCGAGNTIASISVQGDVNPCSFLGAGHNAGNIRQQSFREIWNQSRGFQKIRSLSGTACGDCRDGSFQGGCRARAQVYNGDYDAADPWFDSFNGQEDLDRHPLTNMQLYQIQAG